MVIRVIGILISFSVIFGNFIAGDRTYVPSRYYFKIRKKDVGGDDYARV